MKHLPTEDIIILAQKHQLDLLILFGSYAKGTPHPNSDLDIAIWKSSGALTPNEWEQLMNDLMRICKKNKIDLIDISKQRDPLLHHQIFTTGKCLYESDSGLFINKHADALGQYWDTAQLRKEKEKLVEKKIHQLIHA